MLPFLCISMMFGIIYAAHPTRMPSQQPTTSPLNTIQTATSTNSGVSQTYQSTTTLYQNKRIECAAVTDCYVYCNSAIDACNYLVIDASEATNLHLSCSGYDQACSYVRIENGPTTYANITCASASACRHADFYLEELSSVIVNCLGPATTSTNGGCWASDFFLNNTGTVTVNCLVDYSCYSSDWYLDGVNSFTLNVDGQNGWDGYIEAQNMDPDGTLRLNCDASDACKGYLYCPLDETGSIECKTVCSTASSCSYLEILIPYITYSKLVLICSYNFPTNAACSNVYFECSDQFRPTDFRGQFQTYAKLMYNSTYSQYLCLGSDDHGCCPAAYRNGDTPTISGSSLDCTSIDCRYSVIDLTGRTSFTVDCRSDDACRSAIIIGPQPSAGVDAVLTVLCTGTTSCINTFIDGRYTQATNVNCDGEDACEDQSVYFPDSDYSLASSALEGSWTAGDGIKAGGSSFWKGKGLSNVLIQCETSSGTSAATFTGEGNCGYSYGDFANSVVDFRCGTNYDCYRIQWTLTEQSIATLVCGGQTSCESMRIHAHDADTINADCSDSNSCYGAIVNGPSTKDGATTFSCTGSNSCQYAKFQASADWKPQYLSLECNTGATASCDYIDFDCEGGIKEDIDNTYSNTNIKCTGDVVYSNCCPFGTAAPTKEPTESPTDPSSPPTQIPTDSTPGPTDATPGPTDSTPGPTEMPTDATPGPTDSTPGPTDSTPGPTSLPTYNTTSVSTTDASGGSTTTDGGIIVTETEYVTESTATESPNEGLDAEWIVKDVGGNCNDGYTDLDNDDPYYGEYCKRCEEGTAGTAGNCFSCGTLEESNLTRTECEFIHPWWLYIAETLAGLTCIAAIIVYLYKAKAKKKHNTNSSNMGSAPPYSTNADSVEMM